MEQTGQGLRGYQFGVFEIDPQAGELRRGGLKVKLQEQPFQVLMILLERAGEVVSREELQEKLWAGDSFGDFDHSLNIAINKIREALGDSAENPRFVETLPKRGYRFLAPVATIDSSIPVTVPPPTEKSRTGRSGWRYAAAWLGGVAVVAALLVGLNAGGLRDWLKWNLVPPRIESIAVLPLENLSSDPEQEYFADGMTDALITALGSVQALRVISRTSVLGFKGTKKSMPEIARELNVDAIVEGAILRSGDQVRITAQLIHAPTDRHLWAESYERNVRDVLALQGEVAQAIAREIRIQLTPQERARLGNARPINTQAYEAYVKGVVGPSGQAIESLEQAILLDPGYAPAYAGLGSRYYTLGLFGTLSPAEAYTHMKEAALQALEKDGALPQAYDLLGLVRLHYEWNWPDAEKDFRRALELNPNLADARHDYAHYLLAMGREQDSVVESRRAVELDPQSATLTACLGWHHLYASQYDQAVEQAQKAIRMNPNGFWAQLVLGWAYEQKSLYPPAIAAFEKAVELSRGRTISVASLAHAYATSGQRREAQQVLAKLQEQAARSYVPAYDVATVYLGLGDPDQALEWLEKAYVERSSFLVHIHWDPRFKGLRSDPRFRNLLGRIGLPQS